MADPDAPVTSGTNAAPVITPIDRRNGEAMMRNPQFVLALVVTLCLFMFLAVLAWHPAPDANRDVVNLIMQSIVTGWIGIIAYFFGSNSASKAKDTAIATLASKPNGGTNA